MRFTCLLWLSSFIIGLIGHHCPPIGSQFPLLCNINNTMELGSNILDGTTLYGVEFDMRCFVSLFLSMADYIDTWDFIAFL